MNIRIENWNGHEIRFVEKAPGDWWAIANDIAKAMGFRDADKATQKMQDKYKGTAKVGITSDKAKAPKMQEVIVLNEKGLYRLIMRSNKPEAEDFQDWVYEVIKTLRQATGLAGFEVFRLLDKEHQREAMKRLHEGLESPVKVNYIKANTIANKAISIKHGLAKMIGKDKMPSDWLAERQPILDDAVDLMAANERFGLGLSVSEAIYKKYGVTFEA